MKEFDVTDKDLLIGTNLIEASAGTGKTFSIAILVVRLIIEKSIPVTKMLLVTFTDAAATELKERSIKFIRDAINEFEATGSSGNKVLAYCVANFKADNENGIEAALNRLYTSLLEIDQSKMCTIHSFCQQTLNEFAFETNQSFGKVLLEDISQLINKYCNSFKREVLNSMEYELFEISGLKEDKVLSNLISNALNDKTLYGGAIEINSYEEFLEKNNLIDEEINSFLDSKKELMISKVSSYNEEYSNRTAAKNLIDKDVLVLKKYFLTNSNSYKFNIVLKDEMLASIKIDSKRIGFKNYLHQQAIDWVLSKIKTELTEKNKFTFDDLINQLYLVRSNEQLQQKLRSKYDVVFLDEFQDTDQKQYEIFREIFQNDLDKILFYIGDPKQSIYGFRKADLNTYFKARNSINEERRFEMKVNFRSSKNYIEALNVFFQPVVSFDTFHNDIKDRENQIVYTQVSADKDAEGIEVDCKKLPALTIIEQGDTKTTFQNTIKLLLDSKTTLNKQKVKPSNICVLTRSNRECKEIKLYLNELNVPSVISDDSIVIQSAEAIDLGYILGAFLNSKKSAIQKALLTAIVGLKPHVLHTLDMDKCVELFTDYNKIWIKNGVFVAVNKFLEDFNVITKHNQKALTGQRILSNTRQLLEILQEKETYASLTPNECYLFLKSEQKSDAASEIKAFVQRIESDEDAVKIVTIHKSKGLEYDIVIAPFLDMKIKFHHYIKFYNINKIKCEKTEYFFTDYNSLSKNKSLKELFEFQNHQENARLLYVALTRAKYGSFILSENFENCLAPFIEQLRDVNHSQILLSTNNEFEYWSNCSVSLPNIVGFETMKRVVPKLSFPDANYNKMSYTFLASHPAKSVKEIKNTYNENSYDEFVFSELKKGAKIGNMLHEIFEFIDYSDDTTWKKIISKSVIKYVPNQSNIESYLKQIGELVYQVLNTKIELNSSAFSLKEITRDYRRNEFEFNFSISSDFKMMDLEFILEEGDAREIATKRMGEVQGMMTGFIDLFFEHEGKYYILDWKSNFLGDHIDHYNQENLLNGMNESNYHLQYLIYALALEKYLKSKLSNFDFEKQFGGVIYLFLRGNREGETHGVYTQKVTQNELDRLKGILK